MLKSNTRLALFIVVNLIMIFAIMIIVPVWVKFHGGVQPRQIDGVEESVLRSALVYAGFSVRDGIMMVLASGLGFAVRVGHEKENLKKRELELNAERRQIELKSLKAQLNPHFLFNSLNNIYALIEFAPKRAQRALHDLSSMFRYIIYDTPSTTVTLAQEIQFIREYVELMRLRLGNACDLEFSVDPDVPTEVPITPLLYVTLVENAFKHSSPDDEEYFIRIKIRMEPFKSHNSEEGSLVFKVENSCTYSVSESIEKERSGVGLVNVRRQLNLLYPGSYKFELSQEKGKHSAMIKISMNALMKNIKEQNA
ncbi:MAG: sensor histidine kinase [Muribaculaceae bacterium]|nr:sensor histidine kinase [Muribaculaceae bacterium]